MASCETCTLCCNVMGVTELQKPTDKWCGDCTKKGCAIYDTRPPTCRDFQCFWLFTQSGDNPMPLQFRPDHSRVIIVEHDAQKIVCRSPAKEPLAFLKQPLFSFLSVRALTTIVYVISGKRVFRILNGHNWFEMPSDRVELRGGSLFVEHDADTHQLVATPFDGSPLANVLGK